MCHFVGVSTRSSGPVPGQAKAFALPPTQTSGKAASSDSKTVLRKRPRKHRATPVRGLSLLAAGADRLGLWPKLWEQWVCRTFALTLHACVPRLSVFARAEKLVDGTLTVVVTSSAVASELSFVRDLLLEQINRELLQAVGRLEDRQRRAVRPVLRLQHRVGKLADLPDPAQWQDRPAPRRSKPPPKVSLETQLAVATATQEIADDDLRLLLLRLVGATTRTA